MARTVEDARRALSLHVAADSEELCEEALRCDFASVSSHIYHTCLSAPHCSTPSSPQPLEPRSLGWVHSTYRSRSDGRALRGVQGTRRPQTRPDEHGGRVVQTSLDNLTTAGGVERGGGGAGEILGVADVNVNDCSKQLLSICQLPIGRQARAFRQGSVHLPESAGIRSRHMSWPPVSPVISIPMYDCRRLKTERRPRRTGGRFLTGRPTVVEAAVSGVPTASPLTARRRYFYTSVWTMIVFSMNKEHSDGVFIGYTSMRYRQVLIEEFHDSTSAQFPTHHR
jgi:hypothetical protein